MDDDFEHEPLNEYQRLEKAKEYLYEQFHCWRFLRLQTGRTIIAKRLLGLDLEEDEQEMADFIDNELREQIIAFIEENNTLSHDDLQSLWYKKYPDD